MNWEPWTGCYPASVGCANCYFYVPYAKRHGQNEVQKTDKFAMGIDVALIVAVSLLLYGIYRFTLRKVCKTLAVHRPKKMIVEAG